MRLEVSFLSVMSKLMGGILVRRKQLQKSLSVVCIVLPCSKLPICIVGVVLGANSLGKSIGEIWCPLHDHYYWDFWCLVDWFMRPFSSSFRNAYILLTINYMSKWVEPVPTRTTKARVVVKFPRENIFSRNGMPKAIISDQRIHFDNRSFDTLLKKYSIIHHLVTAYHPQTSI